MFRWISTQKRSWALLVLVALIPYRASVAQSLSPSAQVSLITVAPGEELYSSFGHTVLRVFDPVLNLDRTYNYGTFDFRVDNFYVKFLRGTLPYQLSVGDIYRELYYWQYENRSVRQQTLNLTLAQKQRLFEALETNYRPENREYRYKFYYDNCTTRPRDWLSKITNDSLQFINPSQPTKSYRDWMNDYLGAKPWAQLGMNMALGFPADVVATARQSMYLPNNLHDQLAVATIHQANGRTEPVVANEQTLFQAASTFRKEIPFLADPNVVFTFLGMLIALFTVRRYQQGKVDRWLDRLLFGLCGFLGWFLFLLWVGTDHGVTAWNPTLLYLMPLHLPLIYWATGKNATARRRTLYFGSTAVLILLGMVLSKVPGGVDVVFPLTLLIRCLVNSQFVRRRYRTPARVA